MTYVQRFDPAAAQKAHGGTILASPVLPEGVPSPFGHAWGYLKGPGQMETHEHPTQEFYVFTQGEGFVSIGDETIAVKPGDVAYIPPCAPHSVENRSEGELTWAAFWWNPITKE